MSKDIQNHLSLLELLTEYMEFNNYIDNIQFKEEILNLLFYILNSYRTTFVQEIELVQNLVICLEPYLNENG